MPISTSKNNHKGYHRNIPPNVLVNENVNVILIAEGLYLNEDDCLILDIKVQSQNFISSKLNVGKKLIHKTK